MEETNAAAEPGSSPDRPGQRFVKPAPTTVERRTAEGELARERLVPIPGQRGAYLSSAGGWVVWDRYWMRRARRGDVVLSNPPSKSSSTGRKAAKA